MMTNEKFVKPLFTFEMANNHQGSVAHGMAIISALEKIIEPYRQLFSFAVKFQYRDLDTFIRPDYVNRMDVKNVKRFRETRLTMEEFKKLKEAVSDAGMFTMCTPFDEVSAERVAEHGYDFIKVASCSIGDWPLLEAVAKTKLPVIASTAGSLLENIDNVVRFFKHRRISLALMHCVAEYPTVSSHLEMNQIDLLKKRYPDVTVGFSTHEEPENMEPILVAAAKGARIFERHVGLPTDTITLNKYSSTPEEISRWLAKAKTALEMCGVSDKRYESSDKEKTDLAALQRGVFAKCSIKTGDELTRDNVYYAFPCEVGQLLAGNMSKYAQITAKADIAADGVISMADVNMENKRDKVSGIVQDVMKILKKGNILVPADSSCEISHHYGLDKYREIGVTIIDCVNREYCKKILVVLPNQDHPFHSHRKKEETFTVLYGEMDVVCDGVHRQVHKGESMTVERGVKHKFSSKAGCVFEEISTTHYKNDSFYDEKEKKHFASPRKTKIFLTQDMVDELQD
ncbi:N-acetylneuraminate synthase family protein [Selenomonas ruminantium]|uniref:N-acetylneuraminate synthase n=1 Tax=Selenomonas ruminantium TaxID=971 RepID=A0A1I0YGP4_SELRU|nr:N-acetylneuraminate synthase family protein [Selenomonas ruminantium]SFB12037.1 N-acetylneuraminate synthase [Selenomonas ruminantium]